MNEFSEYIIDCENLVKIYKTPDLEVLALQGLDLQVRYGEVMAIIGNSGSGKSMAATREVTPGFAVKRL